MYTSTTHASLVHDVTDTEWKRSWLCFWAFQSVVSKKLDHTWPENCSESIKKKKIYFNQTWALMLLHLEPPVSLLAEQACPWWVYEQQKGCQNKTATTPMSSWLSVTQISSWLGHGGWDQSSEVRVQLPERQAMMCLYMCLNYKGRYIHFHLTLGLQGKKN